MEDPAELEGFVTRFPEIRTGRIFENGLYLLVLILWIPHSLALYYALRVKHLAPALFGTALSISGLVVMATGALTHIAVDPLSEIYHTAGATPESQATIALIWQATWGMIDAILIAGLLMIPPGFICFGIAMLANPDFGKGIAWMGIALGVIGLIAACGALVAPDAPYAALTVFSLIIFNFVLGWKLFNQGNVTIAAHNVS